MSSPRTRPRLALVLTLVGFAAAATACSAPPRTTTLDDFLSCEAPVCSSAPKGTLVVVVFRVRPPARLLEELPGEGNAILVPEHLRLEHPHAEKIVEPDGVSRLREFNPRLVEQYASSPPPARPGAGPRLPPEVVYAPLCGDPRIFLATREVAIGWAGVGSRVWVRPCAHGKPHHVDLTVEGEALDPCLETAWFPGVDTVYRAVDRRSLGTGDPGREGVPVVVIRSID